jgi:Xaa-Pro aminopeptidase
MITEIPQSEYKNRISRLQKVMCEKDFDIILTFGNEAEPQYVRYFSNYWPSFETAGVFIPRTGKPAVLIPPESFTYCRRWSKIDRIERFKEYRESSEPEYPGAVLYDFSRLFGEALSATKGDRVGLVGYSLMPVPLYMAIKKAADEFNAELVRAENLVIAMKQIKSPNELKIMKEAAAISEKSFEMLLPCVKEGVTETQVIGEAQKLIRQFGAEGEAYPFWCISGENTVQAIARPTHKQLKKGEMIQIQVGARLGGYVSSMGRPVVLGGASRELTDFIQLGLDAQRFIISRLRAGIEARKIDEDYRTFLRKHNAEDCILYGPCHGTGLMEGEHPWIEANSTFTLEENMTFCVDIFLKRDSYGLRFEDVVAITRAGVEEFTTKFKTILVLK